METKVTYRLTDSKSLIYSDYASLEDAEKSMRRRLYPDRCKIFKLIKTTEDITPEPKESTLDDLIESLDNRLEILETGDEISINITFADGTLKYAVLNNDEAWDAAFHPSDYNYSTGFYKSQRDAKIALVTEILLNGE